VVAAAHDAEAVHDLAAVVAEDVADDPVAVVRVDLVQVHAALHERRAVRAERAGEGLRAARVLRVGLHAAQERRQGLAGRLLGGGLVDPELTGEPAHGDLGEDLVDGAHGRPPGAVGGGAYRRCIEQDVARWC
jgi:hypothetical protein